MSLEIKVLGKPGRDNAVYLIMNLGTKQEHILFDCGENTVSKLSKSTVHKIKYLFFSHLHIDHIAGFDSFFRVNFNNPNSPIYIYGPEGTAEILHHRFRGFKWNMTENDMGIWRVHDICENKVFGYEFRTSENFKNKEFLGVLEFEMSIRFENFEVTPLFLNHSIVSIGYFVKETSKFTVNIEKIEEMNLEKGKWIESLKGNYPNNEILINDKVYDLNFLRAMLLNIKEGESFTYLTDFVYDDNSLSEIKRKIPMTDIAVIESQYVENEIDLAVKNKHLISKQSAEIGNVINATKVYLFHFSERYLFNGGIDKIIDEAKEVNPRCSLPPEWMK